MPSIGRTKGLHATSVQHSRGEKIQCSHACLLFVWGFYDDASLRWLHGHTEDIFGVGKVADSPLKAGLCVFAREHRLCKKKSLRSIWQTWNFSLKIIKVKQKIHIRKWKRTQKKTHIGAVLLDHIWIQRRDRNHKWVPDLDLPLALSSKCAFMSPFSDWKVQNIS